MDFLSSNSELIGLTGYLLVNVLNAITPHWSKAGGIAKGILFITEALSFFSSKNNGGMFKMPGQIQKKKN